MKTIPPPLSLYTYIISIMSVENPFLGRARPFHHMILGGHLDFQVPTFQLKCIFCIRLTLYL
jgi:hypothetical protein